MTDRTGGVLRDVLWTEKYRPTSLDELALDDATRAVLDAYLEAGEIPHLLMIGPPGSGKTTVARIIYQSLDAAVLPLNASSDRGIDTVRDKIKGFAATLLSRTWNIVFLDEADAMTADAQTSLRNTMESYAERTRFILTANFGHRIIGAIQSRCQLLTFGAPPLAERVRVLQHVLDAEGVAADKMAVLGYAEKYPDMRRMLNAAQRAILATRGKELPPVAVGTDVTAGEMFDMLEKKNWTGLRRTAATNGFDPAQALRELFWSVPDDHPRAGHLRYVLGRGVHETGFTPDPVILFLGVCAEAMEGL